MSLSNTEIIDRLNKNLPKKTITELSLNSNPPTFSVITSDIKYYCLNEFRRNLHDMDALNFENEIFTFIEFKDEQISINNQNKGELAFKAFESINQVIEILEDEVSFFKHKKRFIYVFSKQKNATTLNDFKTMQSFFEERFGKILNKVLFIDNSEFFDII